MYLKDQRKVIQIKDFRIWEDYNYKLSTQLPYHKKSTSTSRVRKVIDTESYKFAMNVNRDQRIVNANSHTTNAMNNCKSQKIIDAEFGSNAKKKLS